MKIDGELLKKRKENLAKAIEYHGHLCLGQILGVHIAETGLKAIGTIDTKKSLLIMEKWQLPLLTLKQGTLTGFG